MENAVRVGGAGLHVSPICLGTMMIGSRCDERQSIEILDRAYERGIAFLDLADAYPFPPAPETWGRTEEIVGRWLTARPGRRDEVVVATKCGLRSSAGPNGAGGSRKHVIEACEASLRRLGTDHIDLLYLHLPALEAPLRETLHALDDLVRAGKVHAIGLSNFDAWQVALALEIIASDGLTGVTALEPQYNLLRRLPERDLLPLARARDIGVMPYYVLGAGMLTGRYPRGGGLPPDFRLFRAGFDADRDAACMFDVADVVADVAASERCSRAQVVLAWVLAQPGITAPIVGASSPAQIDDLVGALTVTLSDDSVKVLDAVSMVFR